MPFLIIRSKGATRAKNAEEAAIVVFKPWNWRALATLLGKTNPGDQVHLNDLNVTIVNLSGKETEIA